MIYCLGNTNYDIVFNAESFSTATPGGSKLNTAVSLGRLKQPVSFISRVGKDILGSRIEGFLKKNRVATTHFLLDKHIKTNLALAFLDDEKNASYVHYGSEKTAFPPPEVDFSGSDYLLFGSMFAVAKPTDLLTEEIVKRAIKSKSLIIYDPNMRKKCSSSQHSYKQAVLKRMHQSHIIKLSDEDLEALGMKPQDLKAIMGGKYLIVTQRDKEVLFFSDKVNLQVTTEQITPLSTIGAGDGFNAGLISALYNRKVKAGQLHELSAEEWREVIASGNRVAAGVCKQKENYISQYMEL